MRKLILIASVVVAISLGCTVASAQTTQRFVVSASADGSPATITSTGFQLTKSVSLAYEYIVNPGDSSKPRYGSGVANYTTEVASLLPKSVKSKLLVDPSNYLLTFQGGVGRESLAGSAVGAPRTSHVVGNFGIYGGKPISNNAQLGFGYKFILGPHSTLVKVPVGNLVFTF